MPHLPSLHRKVGSITILTEQKVLYLLFEKKYKNRVQ